MEVVQCGEDRPALAWRVEVRAAVIPASIKAFGEGQDWQEIANKLLTCQPKTT